MSSTPLGTRLLKATIDGVVRSAEITSCKITSAESDSDFVSFADTAAGGKRDYALEFTAVQDPADVTSLWYVMWNKTGTDVAIELVPYGGAVVSATNPKFTGTVTVTEPDGDLLGGDADPSNSARFTTDLSWKFTARPVRVIA